jgi:hypothetical protein
MKGTQTRKLIDRLASELLSKVNVKVTAARNEFPAETLPAITRVYVEEGEYDQIVDTPCILIFVNDAYADNVSSDWYDYRLPVDILVYDWLGQSGLPALHKRLQTYQGCLVDVMLSQLRSDTTGGWYDVQLDEPASLDGLVDERYGEVGRAKGYRFNLFYNQSY